MGTYADSRITTARKPFQCDARQEGCYVAISRGDQYLRYRLGQRNSMAICLHCAVAEGSEGLLYRCADAEAMAQEIRDIRAEQESNYQRDTR